MPFSAVIFEKFAAKKRAIVSTTASSTSGTASHAHRVSKEYKRGGREGEGERERERGEMRGRRELKVSTTINFDLCSFEQFIRRLSIIVIEDAILHPALPLVLW